MKGSIRRRSPSSWSIRIDIPREEGGKRRQLRRTVRGSRKEAEAEAARLIHEIESGRGEHLSSGRSPLRDVLGAWLESRDVSTKTKDVYAAIIKHYLEPSLGDTPLNRLTVRAIEDAASRWRSQPRKDGKAGQISTTRLFHIFSVLNAALNAAVRWGYIVANPCARAVHPHRNASSAGETSIELLRTLFRALPRDLTGPAITALGTGLRRGEILGLQWCDIDFQSTTLRVRRSVERRNGVLRFKEPKSQRSVRTVALPTFVLDALVIQRDEQERRFQHLGLERPAPETVVFDNLGQPCDPDTLSLQFYRAVRRRRSTTPIRFHDLRHAYASLSLAAGTALKVVSDNLGHATIDITANTYAHPGLDEKRDAAKRLDQSLRRSGDGQFLG